MADLIRTDDADAFDDNVDADEASGDEAGPVLMKKNGVASGFFADLVDGKKARKGGWDFGTIPAAADAAGNEQTTGLRAKIAERLEQKLENEGDEEGNEAAGGKKPLRKKKLGKKGGAKTKNVAVEEEGKAPDASSMDGVVKVDQEERGTAEHLRTDLHFADLRLSRPLLRAVTDLGFETPTPIQRDVIPPALQGLDVLATAETGSGKTASFLLPVLERLCQSASVRSRKRDAMGRVIAGGHVATKAIIMIPTRELAVQCYAMLKDLAVHTHVTYQLVAGGFESQDQASSLRRQPDLVVATPGRLLDHLLNTQSVHMELLEIVVFDEADRLLELGFRDECVQVMERCSKGRQTMLFSATMNTSVEDLAVMALVKPVRIHASPVNRVVSTLEQEFVKVPSDGLREAVLMSLCSRNYVGQVIVFCATKQAAHRLAIIFGLCGMSFAEIHGNLPQGDRVMALQRFQKGEADFLLATDLAARGLDLNNVATVINFHVPLDISRYIHRVGRTARMGRSGRAVTVYCESEYLKVKTLGRQCCSKVKSKVTKRTIAADAVKSWADKIESFEEDISSILYEESMERELRLADILANRSDNIQKHKADIHGRPAKQWIMTNQDKRKLKEADNERVKKTEEEQATIEEAREKKEEQNRKRKRRRDEPKESVGGRIERKKRERMLQRKKDETAERLESMKQVRASARRQRKAAGRRAIDSAV